MCVFNFRHILLLSLHYLFDIIFSYILVIFLNDTHFVRLKKCFTIFMFSAFFLDMCWLLFDDVGDVYLMSKHYFLHFDFLFVWFHFGSKHHFIAYFFFLLPNYSFTIMMHWNSFVHEHIRSKCFWCNRLCIFFLAIMTWRLFQFDLYTKAFSLHLISNSEIIINTH